jgi:hypothetical protein
MLGINYGNSKFQIISNDQTPKKTINVLVIWNWSLEFVWDLDIGIWDFDWFCAFGEQTWQFG